MLKDASLTQLAAQYNVAQFVSWAPTGQLRHCLVTGDPRPRSIEEGVQALLLASDSRRLNLRCFNESGGRSLAFVYGKRSASEIVSRVRGFLAQGLYVIANETVGVRDGVSGAVHGDIVEFAPNETPRAVEVPNLVVAGSRAIAARLIERVYGIQVAWPFAPEMRSEFSLHRGNKGYRREHLIVWESARAAPCALAAYPDWPNGLSRLCGDKAFGLMVADAAGVRVPFSRIVSRRLPPFQFGSPTGTSDVWLRTAPSRRTPGKYPTLSHWVDPMRFMADNDPRGKRLAAVIVQDGVRAEYSGAAITRAGREPLVEGVRGRGKAYMSGQRRPGRLPSRVSAAVVSTVMHASESLGLVEAEWVFDGREVWIVQLHRPKQEAYAGSVVVPGEVREYLPYDAHVKDEGLSRLRRLVAQARRRGAGVAVLGRPGTLSHVYQTLLDSHVPSVMRRQ